MATFHDKDHNIVEIEEDHGFEIPTQLSESNHDELVNNGEFNIGEIEQDASENVKSDVNNETIELCIGMEFQSLDDALMCYTNYAKHEGFGIRKSRILKSRKNQMVIGQEFVCSKEGYRAKKYLQRDNRKKPPPDETRMGCKAMISVSRKDEAKWVISKFTRDHNHVLASPSSARFHRVHRKRTKSQMNLIDVLDESGIRPSKIMSVLVTESGGIDRVGCIERDIQNYLSNKRQKQLEKGDAQAMLNYFKECQSKNPGFFYAIQMDTEGQLANCFWVDSRSRVAYKFFGDVVTFDPTYLTNRYKMPFVPFTGVNHHHQSILFGCALLWDETVETFVWLLNTWLGAMDGCHHKTIITDQDAAITTAIARVLPNTAHHFCMWHIEKKFPENLSHVYQKFDDFKFQLSHCIHRIYMPSDFEVEWEKILDKYGLRENSWLEKLYSIREKWIPAYVRTSFCAGMSTTQRSESMNKYFKDYINANTPISKFVVQYDKALDARYNKEREKTFKTLNSKPILKTLYLMEEEASKVYTRKMFRMFQDELIHSQQFVAEKFITNEHESVYKVHEFDKEKPEYIVTFMSLSTTIECSCHMFEFLGILCRHQLMVLLKKNVYSLPKHYILQRWTTDAKKGEIRSTSNEEEMCGYNMCSTTLFNNIMVHSLELSEKASCSKKHYDTTIESLQCLFKKLDALKIDDDMTSSTGRLTSMISNQDDDNNNVPMRDPPRVTTKGRPRSIRMKGALELKSNRVTCSTCKKKGHTKRTCTLKNKNMMDNNCQLRQMKRTDFDENNEDIKICGSFYVSSS
ncbi:protein FAR1-RELATED SEQUENCE 5-like [Ipomoea triloba]|uniref:protein FAR1-RELATED SEQUENCE 5-like n=1 Tax=Ipomoea triloba TaxID=35885 RepID=UPI00125E447D|nr:protein FAR1-RELATED SEQUENCE 5-like [Ipomoea triloba]